MAAATDDEDQEAVVEDLGVKLTPEWEIVLVLSDYSLAKHKVLIYQNPSISPVHAAVWGLY